MLNLYLIFSWTINMQGAEGTLYDGEQFQLQFKFGSSYPFESPEVDQLCYFNKLILLITLPCSHRLHL